MFNLSCKEQQQDYATKPVETLKELTTNLGMDKLVEPTTLVEIQNFMRETFGYWARKVNPDGDGEKMYAYNAMGILQEFSCTWARLYKVAARSRDKELRTSSGLRAQLVKMEMKYDGQRTKIQGELIHMRGQHRLLHDEVANCGLSIAGLEQKLATLSLHPTKIVGKGIAGI